MVMKGIVVQL